MANFVACDRDLCSSQLSHKSPVLPGALLLPPVTGVLLFNTSYVFRDTLVRLTSVLEASRKHASTLKWYLAWHSQVL